MSVYVDDIKMAGKKQNIDPGWKVLMRDVDLGEPTSFFDHVYFGCTQSAKRAKKLWTIMEICLNLGFLQEQLKNYHAQKRRKRRSGKTRQDERFLTDVG